MRKEADTRERLGREAHERTVGAEKAFVREVTAPQFEELRAEIRKLRELIEGSQTEE